MVGFSSAPFILRSPLSPSYQKSPRESVKKVSQTLQSETWEPPQFWKKRSRSEKAILGATLRIPGYSRSNSRNGTHDLIYVKSLFSEQLSERLSELVGRQNFSPNSRSVFFKIGGGSRAPTVGGHSKRRAWKEMPVGKLTPRFWGNSVGHSSGLLGPWKPPGQRARNLCWAGPWTYLRLSRFRFRLGDSWLAVSYSCEAICYRKKPFGKQQTGGKTSVATIHFSPFTCCFRRLF